MRADKKQVRDAEKYDPLPSPVISSDGRVVAGFYQLVQSGPRRLGFAVIEAEDQLQPESLPTVPEDDEQAVANLQAAAKLYLSGGQWRSMKGPDWSSFDSGRDSLRWNDANLTVTVSEEGNLWFSHTDSGNVIGITPFASKLIENRGCPVHMMYHNIVFSELAGFDPATRLTFLPFDIIEGDRDSPYFVPFRCDPSSLVHVVRMEPPPSR
jgi:hypothetical protein